MSAFPTAGEPYQSRVSNNLTNTPYVVLVDYGGIDKVIENARLSKR